MHIVVGGDHDDEFTTSCSSTAVDMSIDSYRFLDFASRQLMKAWAARQKPGVIPFTPMTKGVEVPRFRVASVPVTRSDDGDAVVPVLI